MHPNSKFLFENHALSYFDDGDHVLEIGPDSKPSTYEQLVHRKQLRWTTVDLDYGASAATGRPFATDDSRVDHLTLDEYSLPFPDDTFDVVVSGQVLEHVRRIWAWFPEVSRVCKPRGFVITICPVSWPYHEAPVDCWRIFPEGMRALCEEAQLNVVFSTFESLEPRVSRRSYPGTTHRWGQSRGLASTGKDLVRRALGWPTPSALDTLTVARKAVQCQTCFRGNSETDHQSVSDDGAVGTAPQSSVVGGGAHDRDWKRYETILACPTCQGGEFREQDGSLLCEACSAEYSITNGVPVLLCGQRGAQVMPLTHVSNQASSELLEWLGAKAGFTLNLGAGATDVKPENCIEVEYAIFRNTDLVADAHRLPFGDNTISAVLSLNTFEHLRDPVTAARELYRVVKPGGEIYIQTAFLQPLHEEPAHFFNASEFGVRQWFSDFEIDACSVPKNLSPAYSLAWLASELIHAGGAELGPVVDEQLKASTLGEWQHIWSAGAAAEVGLSEIVDQLSDSSTRKLAAGFDLRARKPIESRAATSD